jgi:hypothetical protein
MQETPSYDPLLDDAPPAPAPAPEAAPEIAPEMVSLEEKLALASEAVSAARRAYEKAQFEHRAIATEMARRVRETFPLHVVNKMARKHDQECRAVGLPE